MRNFGRVRMAAIGGGIAYWGRVTAVRTVGSEGEA